MSVSSQSPPPVVCAAGAIFTPFSLEPSKSLAGVTPLHGRLLRLDFCSDETAGKLDFARFVLREMKVQGGVEVASYLTIVPSSGDTARGLPEAAFGDTRALELTLHGEGDRGWQLLGASDGQSVTFAEGKFEHGAFVSGEKQAASLEQEDLIAIAEGACGNEGQLERSVFHVDDFTLESEACRVTHQFGARYAFRKIRVNGRELSDLSRFVYRPTQHNANDSWSLTSGDLVYEFSFSDDLALVGGKPAELKYLRVKKGEQLVSQTRIGAADCGPLVCQWDSRTAPPIATEIPPVPPGPGCEKPWLFFDLGLNTLVDTSHEDPQTHEMIDVHYVPGAREYLARLKALGYHLGLLVDVPEGWGQDDATALKTTQDYIAKAWTTEAGAPQMDWTVFDKDAMFFPPRNEFRKASNSLYLFEKAVALARAHGCDAVHQATRKKEVQLAQLAGLRTYQVGVSGRDYFLPVDKIRAIQESSK